MSFAISISVRSPLRSLSCLSAIAVARPLHALLTAPWLLFLAAVALMMFRTPQVDLYAADRVAFVLLVVIVLMRALLLRQLPGTYSLTWPMLALLLLGLAGALGKPSDPQGWSLFVAKWAVPFALFHLAGEVFADSVTLRRLEVFLLLLLAYLAVTSIATLAGIEALVFPRYILDPGLGSQAGRARGPFLQSVANGVSLNLLGLVALNSYRSKQLKGIWAIALLAAVPLAILATLTRAVWLSFAGSVVMLFLLSSSRRLRRACLSLIVAGSVGALAALLFGDMGTTLADRLEERGTVEYRMTMYEAGWQMFLERPFLGWGVNRTPFELAKRVDGYRQDTFYFHNTYLEILVQRGLVGLGLYLWMVVGLFQLGRRDVLPESGEFLDGGLRAVWLVMVCVYLFNGIFVVMNYEFVNALLFMFAGILAAQNRSVESSDGLTA